MTPLGYITLATLALSCSVQASHHGDHMDRPMHYEKRLTKHLLDNYDRTGRNGRPIEDNSTEPFEVKVDFGIIELRKFDIEKQDLVMVGWMSLEWKDSLLTWDPATNSGFETLAINKDLIWSPDVILANALSRPEPFHETLARVSYEGIVTWSTTYKYHFYCKIEREEMEADSFLCSLNFGSWSMSSEILRLVPKRDRFDAEFYVPNRDWEFFTNKAWKGEVELPWQTNTYSNEAVYEFTLKRRLFFDEEDVDSSAVSTHIITSSLLTFSLVALVHSIEFI